ncbi:MAG: M23 family metallopeptidase [Telluria sp.]
MNIHSLLKVFAVLFLAKSALVFAAPVEEKVVDAEPNQTVLAKRIFNGYFFCAAHREGELQALGDALGTDCHVEVLDTIGGRTFARAYRRLGESNEDWYGWGEDVLSPCSCKVIRVHVNPAVNIPGETGTPPASFVILRRADGVTFVVAHLANIEVKESDEIQAGTKLGVVGNNGYARAPHIHIGAFQGTKPLRVVFDNSAS